MMIDLDITIILPTFNRRDSLALVLGSLREQIFPPENFEVIVIDDGSEEDYSPILNCSYPYEFKYIKQTNHGAAIARNNAAKLAKGKILFFLDDDITVVPEFLSSLIEVHQKHSRAIVIGNLQPAARQAQTIFEEIYKWETATPPSSNNDVIVPVKFVDCLTGMFSVHRSAFFEIGMFQDIAGDGRVAWGDVDFGCRANRLGYEFFRTYKAVGYHDDFSIRNFLVYANRWEKTSTTAVKLFQIYPESQPLLPMFIDKTPIALGVDSLDLMLKKLLRIVASSRLVLCTLEKIVVFLEKYFPSKTILKFLYRWSVGGHIFQGYRKGLVKLKFM